MRDIVGMALESVAVHSSLAPILAFSAGVATSVGPCMAPRLLAVTALASAPRARIVRLYSLAALTLGLCTMYVLIGIAAVLLGALLQHSTWIYASCAVAFSFSGIRMLATEPHSHMSTPCREERPAQTSLGAAFVLGCSFGLVLSPCCTPIVAGIAAYEGSARAPWYFAVTLFAFGLGHVTPLIAAGIGLGRVRLVLERFESAITTVGAALLIALAGYYAVLA